MFTFLQDLHDVIKEFKHLIDNDPIIRMNFVNMIDEVPEYYKTQDEEEDVPFLKNLEEMLDMMNEALTKAPVFGTTVNALPLTTIINWTMGCRSGKIAFNIEKVGIIKLRKFMASFSEKLHVHTTRTYMYMYMYTVCYCTISKHIQSQKY